MCLYGNYKMVKVLKNSEVAVDACIADEIRDINLEGIVTLGCCCGHGEAGQIIETENGFGKWKEHAQPPVALLESESVVSAICLGYRPYPYYYADGEHHDVWQMQLKTGCMTEDGCEQWHEENDVPFEKNLGVIK